jgi:predicted component of type VI protein secretion system
MLFPHGEYVFGRGAECHVRPNSDWVSRQHCLLRVTAEGAFLRDLGSRNGTLVNGTRLLDECCLQDGDQLQIGPLVFEVLVGEPAPAAIPVSPEASPRPATPDRDTAAMRTMDTDEMQTLQNVSRPKGSESASESPAESDVPAVKR